MHVALSDITVRFGALTAVDGVSLAIAPGEIHAVVGENGAGKSTLMNVLFGLVRPASGTISLDGKERRWASPQDAIRHGLGMVHQHFMLQETMTVLENIVLCAEPIGAFGFVDFNEARQRLAKGAKEHGIAVDLDTEVSQLSVGDVVLSVEALTVAGRGNVVGPLSFSVRAGEIVGIAGVSGNGQAELIQALTGLK
ncbi:ATP-binding cassette domain-containing protein, partial [Rhizobiaceae sp. 2RAB30]